MEVPSEHESFFSIAKNFFQKGLEEANNIFSSDYKNDKEIFYKLSFPAVNISFAFELALKALHFYEYDKAPRGHSLYSLFSSLPSSYQDDIIKMMESNYLFKKRFFAVIALPLRSH